MNVLKIFDFRFLRQLNPIFTALGLFLFCVFFVYLKSFLFYGDVVHYKAALFIAFLSMMICYPIYILAINLVQSPLLFFCLSWLMAGLVWFIRLGGADEVGLLAKAGGHPIYLSGEITFFGILFESFTPTIFMGFWAAVILFKFRSLAK